MKNRLGKMKNLKQILISTTMSVLIMVNAFFSIIGCSDEDDLKAGTTITSFSPEITKAGQETVVTIFGTNLQKPNCVKIGTDIILTDDAILYLNSKEIKVKFTPEYATSGVITVVVSGVSVSSTDEFVITSSDAQLGKPVVVNSDELDGGESYSNIEFVGENLSSVLCVMFDDAEAKILLQEAGKLVAQIPCIGDSKSVKLTLKYTAAAGDEEFEEGTEAEVVVRTDFHVTEPLEYPTFDSCDKSTVNGYPFTITGTNLLQVEAVYLNEMDKQHEIAYTLENDGKTDRLVCSINPEIITKMTGNSIIVRFRKDQIKTLTEAFEINQTEPTVNPLENTTVEVLTRLTLTGESLKIVESVAIGGEMAAIVTPEGGRTNTELIVTIPFFEKEITADVVLKYKDITSTDENLLELKLEQQLTIKLPAEPIVTDVPEKAMYNATFELGGTDLDKVEAVYLNEKKDANKLKFELSADSKLVCSLKKEDILQDIQIVQGKNALLIEYWGGRKVVSLGKQLEISLVAPIVTSLSTTSVAFLSELTLNGTDLDMVDKVTIGNQEITEFKRKTATVLTLQVPYFAETGKKTLSVTYVDVLAGDNKTVAYADGVTVTEPADKPTITELTYNGTATTFDITGTNLDKVEEVLLGTTKVTVSTANATKLTCQLPDNTAEGNYKVTVSYWGGNATEESELTIAYNPTVTGMVNEAGQSITEIALTGDNITFIFAGNHLDKITSIVLDSKTIGNDDITVSEDKKTLSFTLANTDFTLGNDKAFMFYYDTDKTITVSGITIKENKQVNYIWKDVKIYGYGSANPTFFSGSTGSHTPCEFEENKDNIHFGLKSTATVLQLETLNSAGTFSGNYRCDGEAIRCDGNSMLYYNLSSGKATATGQKKYYNMVLNGDLETTALSTDVATADGLFKKSKGYMNCTGTKTDEGNMSVGDIALIFRIAAGDTSKTALEFGLFQLKAVDLAEGSITVDIYWEKKTE